jgi:hypothetical protein
MKNSNRFLMLVCLIAILLSAWPQTAFAAQENEVVTNKVPFLVVNKNTFATTLSLRSRGWYGLYAKPGNNTFKILPGHYTYSYVACGKKVSGKLFVDPTSPTNSFVMEFCNDQSATVIRKVKIDNRTKGPITLTFTGVKSYQFTIPTGLITIEIQNGRYNVVATGCGGPSTKFKLWILRNFTWQWRCK